MTLEQQQQAVDGSADGRQASIGGDKVARLPRWTRQEILVLIQGKKVAENRVKRGRVSSGFGFGSGQGQAEPKWASVASYCKRHGVNRGPVQCRKRWSNLAGDFKKIKEWDSSKSLEETDSFWVMRNDLRRERKLPGFFDKEVYDILDSGGGRSCCAGEEELELELELGGGVGGGELCLTLAPASASAIEEEAEALFDSGRSSAAADEGLFEAWRSKEDDSLLIKETTTTFPAPTPISEKHHQSFQQESPPVQGTANEKQQPASKAHGGKKRKKLFSSDGDGDGEGEVHQLMIEALEKNGKLMSSQLEAHNTHLQLDREQRKEHANSLITVLNKLADALGRIADKL